MVAVSTEDVIFGLKRLGGAEIVKNRTTLQQQKSV
jgi:hypothetical protein